MPDMRLIDANALMKKTRRMYALDEIDSIMPIATNCVTVDDLYRAPTIDAVPVVHGRWIYGITLGREWRKCSKCLVSQGIFGCFTYCPNCGAKMDLKERDGNA